MKNQLKLESASLRNIQLCLFRKNSILYYSIFRRTSLACSSPEGPVDRLKEERMKSRLTDQLPRLKAQIRLVNLNFSEQTLVHFSLKGWKKIVLIFYTF